MKSKYMIIISFDAVSSKDIEIIQTLPNFKTIIEKGSLIKNVESVYPTLTYPAHATIVTGKYPKNHGIIDNTLFKAGDFSPNWYWYRKSIKGDTIYDLAQKKGLKTCSLLWPVTGKSNINYNFPEIFPTKPYHNQVLMSLLSGSPIYEYKLNNKFGHIRKGITQPALDDFVLECAKYTIEKYTPELMLIHFTDVDTNRHLNGYMGKEIKESLYRHDKRLGEIIEALKLKGIYEDTNIVALGDHSSVDVTSFIRINSVLKEKGFIECNDSNKIYDYDVYCKSLDGSAYIYLNGGNKSTLKTEVYSFLKCLKEKYDFAIEEVIDKDEISRRGGDIKASFMLEAKKGYYFVDDINGEFIEEVNEKDVGKIAHRYKAVHGYFPSKEDYGTFFIGFGKDFKEGVVLESGSLINHGPTIGKILGVNLENTDGKVINEIIRE
ncbi:MAG: alkaline phosphatase family protein [Clostridium sp.]|nr:alkaline phosphatase family protein [Clostridium sp.]